VSGEEATGETTDDDGAADPTGGSCGPPLSVGAVHAAPSELGVDDPLRRGDGIGDWSAGRTGADPAVDAPAGSAAMPGRSTPGMLLSPAGRHMK